MSRIQLAYVCYLVLAAIAGSALRGDFRVAVLILLGGLALKTWIAERKKSGTAVGPEGSTSGTGPLGPNAEMPEE